MGRKKQDLAKITTNIDKTVLEALDNYADDYVLTRTTAMTILLMQGLKNSGHLKGEKNEY